MSPREQPSQLPFTTSSTSMRRALDELLLAARSDAAIMLWAEIGSEVAVLGQMIHDSSARRGRSLLRLSCPSLRELPTQELVGARGGSLFLHEVGGLAPPLQAQLVDVLDGGATQDQSLRVIAATTHDLGEDVVAGRFRKDLFFRLSVVEVRIPPLRERREDILPLARDVMASLSVNLGRAVPALSVAAEAMLLEYRWPANVRELMNVIERALLMRPTSVIDREALTELGIGAVGRPRAGDDITLRDLERQHILGVITRVRDLGDAAAVLGVSKSTVWRRRIRYQKERATKG